MKKFHNFLRKNWWIIILLILSVSGMILSCWGFCKFCNFSDSLYNTFRLFVLNPPNEITVLPWQLQWARWLIFAAFLWATFRLFIEIIAPKFILEQSIKLFYQNHIIICGVNNFTINLIKKFEDKKIVILTQEINKNVETLLMQKKKLLIGDFTDVDFLKKANIFKANKIFVVTDDDQQNIEISQTLSTLLKQKKRKEALKCFTSIKDRKLKSILEESALFQYKTHSFDGMLFNINEMGIKYGVIMNIDKILPEKATAAPHILLVGVTEKTETILLNLAHCITPKRESFKFTIVEEDLQKIAHFKNQYAYLQDFIEIEWTHKIEPEKQFSTILICIDHQTEALKRAVEIYYLLCEKAPNIVVFCNETDIFSKIVPELNNKRIFPINLFEQIAGYVFDLDTHLENKARKTHYFWNTIFQMNQEWEALSGHFKQTNRNQILDNYLRCFVARGKKFDDLRNGLTSFSDDEKTTLAMMEHRRWMLEKFAENWILGERDQEHGDPYKRHHCLVDWNDLTEEDKQKDFNAINLMIKLLAQEN